jgi:hypothetical protein
MIIPLVCTGLSLKFAEYISVRQRGDGRNVSVAREMKQDVVVGTERAIGRMLKIAFEKGDEGEPKIATIKRELDTARWAVYKLNPV